MIRENTVLRDRYQLEHLVGRGGMADVYLALDQRRQARVAIKVLREDLAEDPDFVRRFVREARTLAQLDHPNIVRFYSFEQAGLIAFIVMDFVDGVTLSRLLAERKGPLRIDEITAILHQVSAALHYAHANGIIHRDLKPGNIMVQRDGKVLLTDFGIAKIVESATMTTASVGTPAYMSPEQILNRPLDARSDIYSLGVTLYQMATGRRPFTGNEPGLIGTGTIARIREAHLHASAPEPCNLNPHLPPAAGQVILKALAKRPHDRWRDVIEMRRAWENAVGGVVIGAAAALFQAQPMTPSPPPLSPNRSSRSSMIMPPAAMDGGEKRNWLLVGGIGAAIMIALLILLTFWPRASAPPAISSALIKSPVAAIATATPIPQTPPATPDPIATLTAEAIVVNATAEKLVEERTKATQAVMQATTEAEKAARQAAATEEARPTATAASIPSEPTKPLGHIVFYSERYGNNDIFIMRADGSQIHRLTDHPADDLYPALSPDGQWVAFTSQRDGNDEIYVVSVSGGAPIRLTYDPGKDRLPVWSPDGAKIAFDSDRYGNLDIFVLNADGSDIQRITDSPTREGHVSWSPDGQQLVFNSGTEDRKTWEIFTVPLQGGAWTRLTNNALVDWAPSWSPLGDQILFHSRRPQNPDLYVMSVTGGNQHPIFTGPGYEWGSTWSPDGRRVAFTSDQSGRNEIYTMNVDGTNLRQITHEGGAYPGWSR